MEKFRLGEASLKGPDWEISFRRKPKSVAVMQSVASVGAEAGDIVAEAPAPEVSAPAQPVGFPVTSPMNGIFYNSPSPSAPAFVKVGEAVTAGQVVALIEAMKVFNEIHAPMAGTVREICKDSGEMVQPGEPLLYIG